MKAPVPYSGRFGEVALGRDVGQLLEVYERQGRLIAWPVPNGAMLAGRTPTERARRCKRMKDDRQMRPGVLDWCVLMKGGRLMLLELKVGRNKLSDEQAAFAAAAELMGAIVYEVRSVADAVQAVDRAAMVLAA